MRSWTPALAAASALVGCGRIGFDAVTARDSGVADDVAPPADACALGPFGTPMTDPMLNSSATDWGPSLSADELTLTFSSSRLGGVDRLFQSTRTAVGAPWSTPVELTDIAPGVTTDDPSLSADELVLYWGFPGVQFATRATLASPWVTAGSIPADPDHSVIGGPDISPDGLTLVFTGNRNSDGSAHMYEARRATTTDMFTSGGDIAGLGSGDAYGSYRGDGLEVAFQRMGAGLDLFHATRNSRTEAFSTPVPLTELNSASDDGDIDLSDDGRTAWFASLRPGGQGSWDLWFATRSCQ